jgi:hypothetical protein
MGKQTGKLYQSNAPFFCNLQSRARTHAVLVIGLFELLGNPTTKLIKPSGPLDWSGQKYFLGIQPKLKKNQTRGSHDY